MSSSGVPEPISTVSMGERSLTSGSDPSRPEAHNELVVRQLLLVSTRIDHSTSADSSALSSAAVGSSPMHSAPADCTAVVHHPAPTHGGNPMSIDPLDHALQASSSSSYIIDDKGYGN